MTFERLRAINDRGTQRADFHVVALVSGGCGSVVVDFHRHRLGPRSAVWIAPGAVHQWHDVADLTGHLVLFVPTAPVTDVTRELVASPDLAVRWTVPAGEWSLVGAALDHLVLEVAAGSGATSTQLPEILLSALVARLLPRRRAGEQPAHPVFEVFRRSVEENFREHHDAEHYARALGYAPRTLSRAVQRATGCTAKAYVVERIVLEAKRLLAHDRLTAAACARALGFVDASNFSVFFRNATGVRPGAWQARIDRSS